MSQLFYGVLVDPLHVLNGRKQYGDAQRLAIAEAHRRENNDSYRDPVAAESKAEAWDRARELYDTPTPPKVAHMIAVDPGDTHVGVAFFETEADPWDAADDPEWTCVDTQEFTPDEFVDALAETIFDNGIEVLVFEKFRLYGDKAREQIGSEFETAQLIGVIKYLARLRNEHVARHEQAEGAGVMMTCELPGGQCADPAKRPHHVVLVKQPADIMKPTTGILRTKGIKSRAKEQKTGGHCVAAELHGWYWVLHGRHENAG